MPWLQQAWTTIRDRWFPASMTSWLKLWRSTDDRLQTDFISMAAAYRLKRLLQLKGRRRGRGQFLRNITGPCSCEAIENKTFLPSGVFLSCWWSAYKSIRKSNESELLEASPSTLLSLYVLCLLPFQFEYIISLAAIKELVIVLSVCFWHSSHAWTCENIFLNNYTMFSSPATVRINNQA